MAGSAEVWLLVASALSKFFRVLVPDIVGFGYSDKPAVEYNLDFFMKFLSEFMQIMQIGKASIVSHSFGARLALEFAIRFDNRVDKLVLCSPAVVPKIFEANEYVKSVMNYSYDDVLRSFADDNYYMGNSDVGEIADLPRYFQI